MKKIYSVLSVLLTIILMGVFVSCERDKEVMLTAVSITNEQITPTYKSATISSTISSEATIRDVFVQYTVTKDFAEYDEVPMQEKDGVYTAELIDLLDNTTYYYRYAASNRHSAIVLQKIQQFATLQPTAPAIRLDSILTVWDSYAQVQVALEFDGGASVTDMGVCWGTQANPTIEDIHKSTKDTVAVLDIPSLQPNTQYYVRAYAVNKVGVAYSEEKVFTTYAIPEVRTEKIADIQVNTALLSATLLFDGNDTATVKGFCWSDKAEPTIDGNYIAVDTTSAHYTYVLSELLPATEYHVRAYAQNKIGVVYGEEVTFTTLQQSSTPENGTENGYAYVDLGLSVKWATCNVGASSPEEYGDYFAWGETEPKGFYDISSYKWYDKSNSSPTKYNIDSNYGVVDNKTTLDLSDDAARANCGGSWRMPTDTELWELREQCAWTWTTQNGVSGYKVRSNSNNHSIFLPAAGFRTDGESHNVGSRGHYWSCTLYTEEPHNACRMYFASGYIYMGNDPRNYGLSIRPVLGPEIEVDATLPIVTTSVVTQITETTAVAGGNVTSDGGASVTERGVCISTVSNPTTSNIKITAGSGIGSFTCNLTGLQANTTYFVRAYAVNSKGTAYGEEVTFTTLVPIVLPTLTTSSVTQITETSAVAGGHVTSDGNASVTDRGVVYSTNQHPTAADNKVSNGSGMGSFTCNLTNLQPNTKYYVRAYAVNSQGTAYGEEVSFTTEKEVVAIPEYVDLGLSVKWASFNVGATKPEEYGDYFAWGEVEPKSEYSWSTYKWCNGYETALIKYNTDEWYGIVDNKIIIESEDDAATKNWGNDWRLPNKYEIDELRDKCTWSWINRNGTYGYQVTGPNGKSIFLPATRYMDGIEQSGVTAFGSYWSSSLYGPSTAWHLGFYSDYGNTYADKRYTGRAVRPVYGSRMDVPKVTTTNISQITATTVLVEGNVIADGGATLVECGACIATNYNPTISDTRFITSSSIGVFACNVVGLLPNTTYYVRAYATNNVGTAYGEVVSFTTDEYEVDGTENGYAYVDLGLPSGTKWATMNVGASKPEDYGDHFAWGETEPKEYYEWSTYKWCDGTYNSLTKYNVYSSYGIVDDKTQLELLDDAANVNWGANWCLPTDEEWTELREQCVWKWRTWNGVKGYIVTGNNSKSIFLPAAGYKDGYDYWDQSYYWSCSLDDLNVYNALSVHISADYVQRITENRNYGFTVRPVLGETIAEITIPTIATSVVTQITETSAVAGGNVTSDGGASVTERGVVYSINQNPTTADNKIPNGSGMGAFTCNLTSLQPNTTYYVRAYAVNSKGTAYGEEVSFTTKEQSSIPSNGTENGHEYVDLGLSVKWAICNVGASYPEDYGDYFAWGETTTKSTYNWSTYKHCNNSKYVLKKYNTFGDYGVVDNKTILELSDDAAHVNMGGEWRMPTETEWAELREQCTWTWSTQDGIYGYKVISNINGNSIFFPTAGCSNNIDVGIAGYYWSIKLYTTYYQTYNAYYYHLSSSQSVGVNHDERYKGMSIRAVCP